VAVRQNFWNDVVQLASARGVKLANSMPCFEYWLLLHFEYTTRADLINGDDAKSAFKEKLDSDYSTNKEVALAALKKIVPKWSDAIRHAEQCRRRHEEAATRQPANPSTNVDLLVRTLVSSSSISLTASIQM
jgi:hypothetical protein